MTEDRGSLNPQPLPVGGGAGAPSATPAAAAAVEPNLVGQVLDGRYQIMQKLGEGALSVVYEARHSGSGRHFAIKVLRASFAAKPNAVDLFLQQARAAADIRHKNVLAIEEFGYTPSRSVYAAVELAVGQTLASIVAKDGKWSWERTRPVAQQMAAALGAAHQANVVHRAFKPANCFVFLDPRGKRAPLVKVADFGLARVGVESTQAAPGATTTTMFGDPEYMAPEQGFGGQPIIGWDIYAFGVVLYRMLTGAVPFSNPNAFQVISQHAQKPTPPLRQIDASIPEMVEQIVMRCLAKTPEQRFANGTEVERAIEATPGAPAASVAAAAPGGRPPRFAKISTGGPEPAGGPRPAPSKQPSVIVAGAIGDDPGAAPLAAPAPLPAPAPAPLPAPAAAPGLAPPSAPGVQPSSPSAFLASRPGLRMGLGASVDDPSFPATIAPGSAVAAPTVAPGMGFGPPSLAPPPSLDAGGRAPPLGAGPGLPPIGAGPGLPPPGGGGGGGAGGGLPPIGAGPGLPPPIGSSGPAASGPGLPPLGSGPGLPPIGAGPGLPPIGSGGGPGLPPPSAGPGLPPIGAGPGLPPIGGGPGLPPPSSGLPSLGAGPGLPPPRDAGPSGGPGYPPVGGASPYPPTGGGSGLPPLSAGPGMPGLGAGPGMPRPGVPGPGDGLKRGMGPGMPPASGIAAGAGAGLGGGGLRRPGGSGIPPRPDPSGPNAVVASSPSRVEPPTLTTEHVEYDDDQPKRRPLMFVGIAIAVVLVALGIGWLIVSDMEADDGDIAKVTRAQKGPDVDYDADEPEPQPEPEDEVDETPIPVVKKKAPPKRAMTFEQSLAAMKGRIRNNCAKVGPGPVQLDTLALKTGGSAIAPKIKPKGPVGDCARRIVENWKFPASDKDHAIKGQVRLR